MSTRVYRLLRNNKEEGPFSADELIRKNLKPYDLIWVEGRSAAWLYPGELSEFKKLASLPGEISMDNTIANSYNKPIPEMMGTSDTIIPLQVKQKPRYKITAAWSRVQTSTLPVQEEIVMEAPVKTPALKIFEQNNEAASTKPLDWKDAWLDWEKEKVASKAGGNLQISQLNYPGKKTVNENYVAPAVLETKFEQPLDDLKYKYIENALQMKQAGKSNLLRKISALVIPVLALAIIFSVGYWLLNGSNKTMQILASGTPQKQEAVKEKSVTTIPVNTEINAREQNTMIAGKEGIIDKPPAVKTQRRTYPDVEKTGDKNTVKNNSDHTGYLQNQKNNYSSKIVLPQQNSNGKQTQKQQTKPFDPKVINNIPEDDAYNDPLKVSNGDLNAANARPVKRRTNGDENVNTSNLPKNQVNSPFPKNENTSENYVEVPSGLKMIDGVANLKIQNISDVNLDLVVVDVQYFDASGNYRKGETIYLHNLKAGKSIIVKTPKDSNAQFITSKVSLISSDAGNVYVVGDH